MAVTVQNADVEALVRRMAADRKISLTEAISSAVTAALGADHPMAANPPKVGQSSFAPRQPLASGPIDEEIGRRIRARRRAVDLSQTQLGVLIGLTYQQIQKFETGQNRVAAPHLIAIAQALGVSADHLLGLPTPNEFPVSRTEMELIGLLRSRDAVDDTLALLKKFASTCG